MVRYCCDLHPGAKRASIDDCLPLLMRDGLERTTITTSPDSTLHHHHYPRLEGEDTVCLILSTLRDTVYTVSGLLTSSDTTRAIALILQADTIQSEIAQELGCTRYNGSIKGAIGQFHRNHDQITALLATATASQISQISQTWRTPDGTISVALTYRNPLLPNKKHTATDRIQLTLTVTNTSN